MVTHDWWVKILPEVKASFPRTLRLWTLRPVTGVVVNVCLHTHHTSYSNPGTLRLWDLAVLFNLCLSSYRPEQPSQLANTHTLKLSETPLNTSNRERNNSKTRKYTLFALAELMSCIRWVTWQQNHLSFQHNGNNFLSKENNNFSNSLHPLKRNNFFAGEKSFGL